MLPDDTLLHLAFHHQELLRFLLLHPLQWNAGDFRDDVHHVVTRHDDFSLFTLFAPLV